MKPLAEEPVGQARDQERGVLGSVLAYLQRCEAQPRHRADGCG